MHFDLMHLQIRINNTNNKGFLKFYMILHIQLLYFPKSYFESQQHYRLMINNPESINLLVSNGQPPQCQTKLLTLSKSP